MDGDRMVVPARDLAARAADLIEKAAADAVAARGAFHLVLAGGGTPRATYEALAARDFDGSRWNIWFGDERWVPHDHPESNYRMACEAWLDHGSIPSPQIHPIPTSAAQSADSARAYERQLEAAWQGPPRFDLVLLGMGDDGHTASLFAGTPALEERERWVVANPVASRGTERVTLTYPAINGARLVIILVAGASKRARLESVWRGDGDEPVRGIAPTDGRLIWLVDEVAAGSFG